MRTMQECYEEALRRSEERIKERKKRRTHLLVACIPLVLCLTIFAGFLLPGFGVSTDMAAPEAALPLYNAESAMIQVRFDNWVKTNHHKNQHSLFIRSKNQG